MNRVPKDAKDVTHIPAARTQNNSTASTKSTFNDSASDSSGEEETGKRHSFSRKLAGEVLAKKRKLNPKAKNAVHECIVLKYLAYKVRVSKNNVGGKKWFYATLEELTKVFPYIGKTTIYEIVIRLEKLGYLEISNSNKWHRDKTFWYHVPSAVCHAAESDVIYFDSLVARETSIPAAVLLGNFEYWSKQGEGDETPVEVELSPVSLAKVLPFSVSTIKLGLSTLDGKYIQKLSKTEPLYGLPEIDDGLNPNSNGLNPNMNGLNPNSNGLNPNDITHCKPVSNPLETPSKPKPAVSVCKDVSDDTKANDERIHSFNDGIAPCADEQDRNGMGHEKVTSGGSEPIPSSTSAIPGEAFDVEGAWPDVPDYEELHGKNRSLSDAVRTMEDMPSVRETLLSTVQTICLKVLSQIDQGVTDELYENGDKEEIVRALLPYHQQFFSLSTLTADHPLFDILYYGSLEAMVGAMLWESDPHMKYFHPLTMLNNITYKVHLVFWRRAEDLRVKSVDEEFAQWRKEYASVDEHKENDADLSPAEKMRVFRNALNAKNKVGWIWFDQTHQTQRIQVSKLGLQRIQKLFELNLDLTPGDLLPIMDACMELYSGQPKPPKDFKRHVQWHARTGYRLDKFASYLKTIVKQLGIASPVGVYLNDTPPVVEEEAQEAMAA